MLSPTARRICEEFDLPKDIVDRQACSSSRKSSSKTCSTSEVPVKSCSPGSAEVRR